MATKKNPKVQLPKQWTTAQVRVNPQGKVQIKINPAKVTNPERHFPVRLRQLLKRLEIARNEAAKASTFAKRLRAKATIRKIEDQIAYLK